MIRHARWAGFLIVIFNMVLFAISDSWIKVKGAEIPVFIVDGSTRQVNRIETEYVPIVNEQSIRRMSRDFTAIILNVNPGLYSEQLKNKKIISSFISKKYYDLFIEQYSNWLSNEYSLNNISIKESVVFDDNLVMSGEQANGIRFWRYTAVVPTLDRALGQNELKNLRLEYDIVYIPESGNVGIFSVKIF